MKILTVKTTENSTVLGILAGKAALLAAAEPTRRTSTLSGGNLYRAVRQYSFPQKGTIHINAP